MTNDEKLMQQAHDALLNFENDISDEMFMDNKKNAQPEPEELGGVVVKAIWDSSELVASPKQPEPEQEACPKEPANVEELYTAPPQRIYCGCGDQIMPDDDEAMCGTCIAFGRNAPPQRKEEPEPVAWRYRIIPPSWTYSEEKPNQEFAGSAWDRWQVQPLYTAPPQREWQGLTDEEITALKRNGERYISSQDFARAVEAKLKAKNAT